MFTGEIGENRLIAQCDRDDAPISRVASLAPTEILSEIHLVLMQCAGLLAVYLRATENYAPNNYGPPQKISRQIEACILEAAPRKNEPPISRRKLAKRAGYAYTPHFRAAVTALIARKLLAESSKGVWRIAEFTDVSVPKV